MKQASLLLLLFTLVAIKSIGQEAQIRALLQNKPKHGTEATWKGSWRAIGKTIR